MAPISLSNAPGTFRPHELDPPLAITTYWGLAKANEDSKDLKNGFGGCICGISSRKFSWLTKEGEEEEGENFLERRPKPSWERFPMWIIVSWILNLPRAGQARIVKSHKKTFSFFLVVTQMTAAWEIQSWHGSHPWWWCNGWLAWLVTARLWVRFRLIRFFTRKSASTLRARTEWDDEP